MQALVWHKSRLSRKLLLDTTTGHERRRALYGQRSRYLVTEFVSRYGETRYLVEDAETMDDAVGLPAIIRDEPTLDAALAGLPTE